jgi:hypothetical protein
MKTIRIHETDVSCSHEVKRQANGPTILHISADAGDGPIVHIHTIGSVDQPIPIDYDQQKLQDEFDAIRQRCAAMAESHRRGAKLASGLE